MAMLCDSCDQEVPDQVGRHANPFWICDACAAAYDAGLPVPTQRKLGEGPPMPVGGPELIR